MVAKRRGGENGESEWNCSVIDACKCYSYKSCETKWARMTGRAGLKNT